MDREYDLFEIYPDGSPIWRDVVSGREKAILKLRELSTETANEVRVMHLSTNTVVAATNTALNVLCVPPDGSRDAADRALQPHCAPDGRVDLAAVSGSDPKRPFLPFCRSRP